MRRLRNVTALAAVTLMVAGCGLTENGAQPGVAASVDGASLALSKVDQAVIDYCAVRAANPKAETVATSGIRGQFVLGWAQAQAVEHLAAEYDVDLPTDAIDPAEVRAVWGQLGTIDDANYDTFEWLTWIQGRVAQPVFEIGRTALARDGATVQGQQPAEKGGELILEWLETEKPRINPVFGNYDTEQGIFAADDLTIAVSDTAKAGADSDALTPPQVAALPAAQQCGPAAAQAQAPVPGA